MTDKEEEWIRKIVDLWRHAAPVLERRSKQDLRNFDNKKNWKAIDALLQLGVEFAAPKTTSGLVEWQRLLHKNRKRSGEK